MQLGDTERVISMVSIKRPDSQIIVVGERGYGKRTNYEDFRLTKRGAKGVISMNITDKTGEVVSIMEVQDTEDLVVMTVGGILIRQQIKDIRIIGRNTQGVRLIRLEEGDKIADITTVPHEEDEDEKSTDNDADDNKSISSTSTSEPGTLTSTSATSATSATSTPSATSATSAASATSDATSDATPKGPVLTDVTNDEPAMKRACRNDSV